MHLTNKTDYTAFYSFNKCVISIYFIPVYSKKVRILLYSSSRNSY